jgi:hypothetical protein
VLTDEDSPAYLPGFFQIAFDSVLDSRNPRRRQGRGIVGTARLDRLCGTRRADVIVALGISDRITAAWANDVVYGGTSNDRPTGRPR